MAAISYPTTGRDAYLTDPWEAPNGSKWTWGGDAKPRWTAWSEPPLTEIAWDDVTSKPATFAPSAHTHDDRYYTESEIDTALSGKQASGDYATNTALTSGLAGKSPTAGSTSIVTLGTVTTGTWNGTPIAVANGGTGSTTEAGARTALGLVIGTNVLAPNGNGSGLTNLSWSAIGGTGTAASPTFTGVTTHVGDVIAPTIGATTPGTGAFTTVSASGAANLAGGVSSFGNAAAVATTFNNLKGAHFDRHVCSPANWQLGWTSAASTVAGTGSTTATSHGANASSGATASSRGQLALPGTVTMFAAGSTTDSRYIDWSKRVTIGFALTMIVDATANGQCYLKIGSSSATGDLASRSIGIRVNRYALVGQCHNGTTLTTSATLYTFSGVNVCAYITLQSDGAGNVAVYINGSLVATMTGGPTTEGALTAGVYFEVLNNADASNNRWQVSPINYRCNSFNS